MYKVWIVLLILSFFPAPPAQAGERNPQSPTPNPQSANPDQVDPLAEGLARARQERKYLLVVVYEDDCEECTRFEETVFKAANVARWIERHAVLARLNDSQPTGRNFAVAGRIHTFPTVLFLANDGRELGRQVGYVTAPRFLIMIYAAIRSDAIRGDGLMDPWAGQDVVLGAMDKAGVLMVEGKFDEALEWYVWCFEHRAARSPIFVITHLPPLIDALARLGERHPPAKKELINRIAIAEHNIVFKRQIRAFWFYIVKHGNLTLGREDKILALYDVLKHNWPGGAAQQAFGKFIYEPLLHARRYEDLGYSVNNPEELDTYFSQLNPRQQGKTEARRLLSRRYEVLLGLGRDADAAEVANRLIGFDRSAATFLSLAQAGYRSGRATRDLLHYARNANLMTDGKDNQAVMVLARLLAMNSETKPEALQLLNRALGRVELENTRKALRECLTEVQAAEPLEQKKDKPVLSRGKKDE